MSDIYLQITETPTVVTLSAPVISGALASTVTVANTVTVALDANSLSALENVTVTVGAAITGTVTVSNFPASQAVTFSAVSISNFPASQAVTFGQAIVSASNITGLNNSVGTDGNTPTSTNFIKIGGHQDGANQVEHIVHVSAGGAMKVDASDSTVTFGTITGTVTIGNTVTIAGTVTANPTGTQTIAGSVTIGAGTAQIGSVTASNLTSALAVYSGGNSDISVNIKSVGGQSFGQGQTWVPVAISEGSLPTGTNRIGVVTIGGGTVTIGAGTAQIGSVTVGNATTSSAVFVKICGERTGSAPNETREIQTDDGGFLYAVLADPSFPNAKAVIYDPVAGNAYVSVRQTASVTIGSLPAISGTVTANTFALQGTAVTTSNFTSTTASTVLANYNATREVLTIFNEGAGQLFVCAGATCTTVQYQVRLLAGDYYEVPNHQSTITHSAVFATAGTARIVQIS